MIRIRRIKAAAPYYVGGIKIPADTPFLKLTFTADDIIEVAPGIFAVHVWGNKLDQLKDMAQGKGLCTVPERSGFIKRLSQSIRGRTQDANRTSGPDLPGK